VRHRARVARRVRLPLRSRSQQARSPRAANSSRVRGSRAHRRRPKRVSEISRRTLRVGGEKQNEWLAFRHIVLCTQTVRYGASSARSSILQDKFTESVSVRTVLLAPRRFRARACRKRISLLFKKGFDAQVQHSIRYRSTVLDYCLGKIRRSRQTSPEDALVDAYEQKISGSEGPQSPL